MTMRIRIDRKVYPARDDAPARCVFENFSLDVEIGDICAITGQTGIGKSSSCCRSSRELDTEFDGTITGVPNSIGYQFQAPRLLPWRTAEENLALVLSGDQFEAGRWLSKVGLTDAAHVYPSRLSVGMARRVGLARALAVAPALLLLDEPFAALDPQTTRQMVRVIRDEVAGRGTTVLLVTHSSHDVGALATRVVALDGSPARIVRDAPVRQPRAAE